MRLFRELAEQEVLALAISNEEEDGRIYADYAGSLRDLYPDTAGIFDEMAAQEEDHRRALIDLYVERYGRHIPYITRRDVRSAPTPNSPRAVLLKGLDAVRREVERMEHDASRFYREAADRCTDAPVRKLLGDLASAELDHLRSAGEIEQEKLAGGRREREDDDARRRFVVQIVQPGLVGLMDGSVSTLAPVFAAAFATHRPWDAFLVGMAASIGAGISMGFAEALADDGRLSGRGAPLMRGLICGLMTILGGVGHTLPFLIADFWAAIVVAAAVVLVELSVIAWVQYRFMDTSPASAAAKVMLGGALVLAAGIAIGSG
ncbi:iron exporter MbfA [Sphingomonas sp.]|uniref:iron exporter MbfA n=1 Tax=Sphingomonas sp. TaxID=28214 RepID=UPI003B006E31